MCPWSVLPIDGDGREERCIANANPVSEQACRREFEQTMVQRGEGLVALELDNALSQFPLRAAEPARRCIAATDRGSRVPRRVVFQRWQSASLRPRVLRASPRG